MGTPDDDFLAKITSDTVRALQGRAGEGQGRGVVECIRQDGMEMKLEKELGIV